ncbi:MAG: hypothetical protein H7122_10075 [Chitinophagaceae bacterium]|nr:hypothetical protein [Chitinophagaceae bacterium]
MTIILPYFISCQSYTDNIALPASFGDTTVYYTAQTVEKIQLPPGFRRMDFASGSFAGWLRTIGIRKDKRVFLYNGELKRNQSAQFTVLDIPIGKKDLQQCADAVMRLRAQYLYDHKRFDEISFADNNGRKYNYSRSSERSFENYLEKVFSYCGTKSLEKQLKKLDDFSALKPGDVLIKGGSPGHAVIVMDMALNAAGTRIYLLAQSYMPAQDIHILRNPIASDLSPWYELNGKTLIYTPEWVFEPDQARKW